MNWLFQMVDPVTGYGPNLGANDGTLLFKLSSAAYRDYRPSVQLGQHYSGENDAISRKGYGMTHQFG